MKKSCLRCGYTWHARMRDPLRCPGCKSVRWNREVVNDICLRCGAEWVQRRNEVPKYCPVCHSAMWNSEKRTYTCPRCGKTRILRSNSRIDLCPSCDEYFDKPPKPVTDGNPSGKNGICPIIRLWSDGRGSVLSYTRNDSGTATLYECGKLVGTINIGGWCRNQGISFCAEANHDCEKLQKTYKAAVEKIRFNSEVSEYRVPDICELRRVNRTEARIIALRESGMDTLAIALKLGIPFTEVMDVLSSVPPVRGNGTDMPMRGGNVQDCGTGRPGIRQKCE